MKTLINSDRIKQKGLELGFHKVGIASADADFDREKQRLQAWLDKGYQADMAWMANPKRLDIRALWCWSGKKSYSKNRIKNRADTALSCCTFKLYIQSGRDAHPTKV